MALTQVDIFGNVTAGSGASPWSTPASELSPEQLAARKGALGGWLRDLVSAGRGRSLTEQQANVIAGLGGRPLQGPAEGPKEIGIVQGIVDVLAAQAANAILPGIGGNLVRGLQSIRPRPGQPFRGENILPALLPALGGLGGGIGGGVLSAVGGAAPLLLGNRRRPAAARMITSNPRAPSTLAKLLAGGLQLAVR
jgi:hypothetical protein